MEMSRRLPSLFLKRNSSVLGSAHRNFDNEILLILANDIAKNLSYRSVALAGGRALKKIHSGIEKRFFKLAGEEMREKWLYLRGIFEERVALVLWMQYHASAAVIQRRVN